MEATRQNLFGTTIVLTPAKVSANAIRLAFKRLELIQFHRISDGLELLFSNLDDLYERSNLFSHEIRALALEEAMKILAAHGFYELSEQQFFESFMGPYDSWDQHFEPIADAYEAMLDHTAELDAHRTARRKGRAKWVGLNERGVHEADAKNLISNVGHGVFNLMAKGVTAISNAIKKDEIFKSRETLECLRNGIASIISAARQGTVEALNKLKPGSVYAYSEDEATRAAAIVEHVSKGRVPEAEQLPALLRAIQTFPYDRDAYVLLLQHGGGDAGRLDAAVEYFGLQPLESEKKQLFEIRRHSMDLSTLHAIDAQLPALIAYAQKICYTHFAQEAISLRAAAADRIFKNYVSKLGESSVAEILAKTGQLRAYAAELGVGGADAALAKILTAARLHEFRQEATKYPLDSPEDCDESLLALEAYAHSIGFENFDAWAEETRNRAKESASKRKKKTKNANSKDEKPNPNTDGHAASSTIEMLVGFVVIALIAYGGYKAFAYLTSPAKKEPAPYILSQEVSAPAPAPAPERFEMPMTQQNQSVTIMEGTLLRPLSPAAEVAIREGMVDIDDPAVLACTDSKVLEFRKAMGEEAVLRFDMYNEFAVDCGFNI